MLMNDRRDAIRDLIVSKGEATVGELCELFPGLSSMTIRRDLAYLESTGSIIRTHGGARASPLGYGIGEGRYIERENAHIAEKSEIARKATSIAMEGQSIFLDSGTTAMAFARSLPDKTYQIITSAPNIALEIIKRKPKTVVFLCGGELNPKTLSCSGYGSAAFVRDINVDIAFLVASGYSINCGFTVGNYQECEFKKAVISKVPKTVIMVDSSKFSKDMPYTFAREKDINYIATDGTLPDNIYENMKLNDVIIL